MAVSFANAVLTPIFFAISHILRKYAQPRLNDQQDIVQVSPPRALEVRLV